MLDVAIVVVLLLPAPIYAIDEDLASVPLVVAQVVPLLWRRTRPAAVLAAVALATAAQVPVNDLPLHSQLAVPIAVFSAARFGSARVGLVALVLGEVGAAVAALDWTSDVAGTLVDEAVTSFFLTLSGIVVTAWALGTLGRTRAAYVDSLVERADRIRRDAEQRVALAAADERARIAREMHDVVAHGLSVIVVQADGARYAAARDPEVAVETLARIGATGREALGDMRQLLGLLRAEDGTGRSPLPGLGDLPALCEESAAHADLVGLDRPVPPAAALTAYRVVQEALTNVRKHAGPGARAHVSVVVDDGAVEVEVVDDGRGAAAGEPDDGHGHGLVGMRERLDVHGGDLVTGPRPGGGFGVSATIPL